MVEQRHTQNMEECLAVGVAEHMQHMQAFLAMGVAPPTANAFSDGKRSCPTVNALPDGKRTKDLLVDL